MTSKVKEIIVKKLYSDEYMINKEGEYFGETHYKNIIKVGNIDCYWIDENENKNILFKVRRKVIPDDIAKKVYDIYIKYVNTTKKNDNSFLYKDLEKSSIMSNKSFRNRKSKISGFYDKPLPKLLKLLIN